MHSSDPRHQNPLFAPVLSLRWHQARRALGLKRPNPIPQGIQGIHHSCNVALQGTSAYAALSDAAIKYGLQHPCEDMRTMGGKQVTFETLDLSDQLRMVMASERLTVTQMAEAAGVSKSAMEKYLAGPSSPRATAIVALCTNLGLSIEWLLFGYSDNDWRRVRDTAFMSFVNMMQDIKQDQDLAARLDAMEAGSKEFVNLVIEVATSRAEELADHVRALRQKAMQDHAAAVREATGEITPFRKA